jgi:ATP-dependent Clp protease adapter protein ClpS
MYNTKNGLKDDLSPETEELEDVIVDNTVTIPAKVIMFNDDWHTFEEVIGQLIKAINCSSQQAEMLAYEAHEKGKVAVFEGELPSCLRVSSILEEIALHTQIEY